MARKPDALLSWHSLREHPQTARQLFEALDDNSCGRLRVEQVLADWPGHAALNSSETQRVLDQLSNGGGDSCLAWPQFRAAVRLWKSLPGPFHEPPSLRRYLIQSTAETSLGIVVALAAAEAACLACAAAGEAADWTQLCSLGGVGAALALLPLDSSSMQPKLRLGWADDGPSALINLGPTSRQCLFLAGSAAVGVMLAPAAPLLAATIGDPKSKGYGPLAVAALSAAQLLGQSAVLTVLPDSWMKSSSSSQNRQDASETTPLLHRREDGDLQAPARPTSMFAAFGGGAAAAALGLAAAGMSNRPGARSTILTAATVLAAHGWVTAVIATSCHARGQPEPLKPALAPALGLLAALQGLLPAT
eukprot:TRINITY_DN31502_c0_g1_i1.p1 TRINITY_DN31502_c0_g1~~TRINITY_DN31502_c0_g1_i1.p1  ORF type:complete len:362 (+),score=60.13 TRINITY_DN31502_c0_g1_i1:59-1144(+)